MTMIITIQILIIFGYFIEKYKFDFHFLSWPYFVFFDKYILTLLEIPLLFLQENKTLNRNVVLIVLDILVFCSPRKLDNIINICCNLQKII